MADMKDKLEFIDTRLRDVLRGMGGFGGLEAEPMRQRIFEFALQRCGFKPDDLDDQRLSEIIDFVEKQVFAPMVGPHMASMHIAVLREDLANLSK